MVTAVLIRNMILIFVRIYLKLMILMIYVKTQSIINAFNNLQWKDIVIILRIIKFAIRLI